MAKKCLGKGDLGIVINTLRGKVRKLEKAYGEESDLVHLLKTFRYNLSESSEYELEKALDRAIEMEYGHDITKPYFNPDIQINEKYLADAVALEPESSFRGYLEGFEYLGNQSIDPDDNDKSMDLIPGLTGQKINAGLDGFDALFIAAVGTRLERNDLKDVFDRIKSSRATATGNGFENWYDSLSEKLVGLDKEPLPARDNTTKSALLRTRLLEGFYIANRMQNKVGTASKNVYVHTNLDPKKISDLRTAYDLYKKQGIRGIELSKALQTTVSDAITNSASKALIKQLPINISNKTRIPEKEGISFADLNPLADNTVKISIEGMVDLVRTKDGFLSYPSHKDITLTSLHNLEYAMGNNAMLAPLGMISSSKGYMLYAKIDPEHVRKIFPTKDVIKHMKEIGYPDTFISKARSIMKDKTVISVAKGLRQQAIQASAKGGLTSREKTAMLAESGFELKKLQEDHGVIIERHPSDPNRIGTIIIPKSERKKGVGTKIFEALKKEFIAKGKSFIDIQAHQGPYTAAEDNKSGGKAETFPDARPFWKKMGFEKVGESKWMGDWVDDMRYKLPADNQKIIERFQNFERIMKVIGKDNLSKALKPQTTGKNPTMTKPQFEAIIESVDKGNPVSQAHGALTNAIFIPSILSKYQWFKMHRGKDFMMGPNGDSAYHHFDRLRLNYSKGIETEGVGPRESILIDENKVYYKLNGKRMPHMAQIPGIEKPVNIFDGASFVSSGLFNRTGKSIGQYKIFNDEHNFGALKTVVVNYEVDNNGQNIGYIEKKHAEFLGIDGLEIYDKESDELIARMVKEPAFNNELVIYNSKSDMVDEISDLDATKSSQGIYDLKGKSHDQFTLPESSRRIVIMPKSKANKTATGFVQYLNSLNYNLKGNEKKALDNYTNTLMGIIQSNTDAYLTLWHESGRDRDILWNIVKHQYGEQAEMKDALRQNLAISGGAGIMHEKNLGLIIPQMINNLLIKGALGGRTMHDKVGLEVLSEMEIDTMSVGSHYTFKPGRIVKENHVMLGADSAPIFNKIKKKSGLDSVPEINEWLKENPQNVLVYRFPIVNIGSMESKVIEEFVADEGTVIYNHPNDTFGTHTGDYDIDGAEVILISPDQAAKINSFQSLPFYKNQKKFVADIKMHKTITPPGVMDAKGNRQTMLELLQGMNAQGTATNMKSVATTLAMKFGDITFNDGVTVRPKQLTDTTVMDYAPLSINLKKFNSLYGDNDQMMIVNKDGTPYKGKGEKYLQTSVAHEYTQIVNMAVDNIKSGILVNVAGAKSKLWFTERMFDVVNPGTLPDGKLTPAHLEVLNSLAQLFKYSNIKKMRNSERVQVEPREFIAELKERERFLKDPLMLKAHVQTSTLGTKEAANIGLKLSDDIEVFDAITPEEKWLFSIIDSYDAYADDPRLAYDIESSIDKRRSAHFMAAKATIDSIMLENTFSSDALEAIKTWVEGPKNKDGNRLTGFNGEYYGALRTLSDKLGKTDLIDRQASYDRELFGIISTYKTKLLELQNKHGEGAAKLASAYVIRGVDVVYRRRLPDANALHEGTWTDYMESWDLFMSKKDSDFNNLTAELLKDDVKQKKHTIGRLIALTTKNKGKCK